MAIFADNGYENCRNVSENISAEKKSTCRCMLKKEILLIQYHHHRVFCILTHFFRQRDDVFVTLL